MYIHEHDNWTDFRWDGNAVSALLDDVCREQGRLFGRLNAFGFDVQLQAMAENLTHDVVYNSEIEGVRLNADEVRSSLARRLGLENVKYTAPSHYVDNVVAVLLDAVQHYDRPISEEKLCAWQSAFFPSGFSEGSRIEVGRYRTHEEHIVLGMFGRERVHYVAPSPERVPAEMAKFIAWFNAQDNMSAVVKSAVAHLWFVSIHPFEDGNGRLARTLADICLARGDKSRLRFYNISSEINRDKKHYYDTLERAQHGDGDITEWLAWYLRTLLSAVRGAYVMLNSVLSKSVFWQNAAGIIMSARQTATLNRYLDGYEAKITSKKWSELNKCSTDTANRDLRDLVAKGVLREDVPGAKRPSYSIVYLHKWQDFALAFADVQVIAEGDCHYLVANHKAAGPVRERISQLDAERFMRGEFPLEHMLMKYCAYLVANE